MGGVDIGRRKGCDASNSYWSAPSVPPPTKKFVENVIDLSEHVEIDLSHFRQVSNIFCRRLFAFVGNMFPTCWKLVENMLQTMSKTCFRHVFDKIDLMEFGHNWAHPTSNILVSLTTTMTTTQLTSSITILPLWFRPVPCKKMNISRHPNTAQTTHERPHFNTTLSYTAF